MAIKVIKRAEVPELGKFGGVPVSAVHSDGKTVFNFGFAPVTVAELRKLFTDVNEVLTAINEPTL